MYKDAKGKEFEKLMERLYCTVTGKGVLPEGMKDSLKGIIPKLAGESISITIKVKGQTPSVKQRKYYFGVVVPAFVEHFAENGDKISKDQAHDSMMRFIGGFGNPYVNPFTGEPDARRMSWNDLTVAQAEGYHTLCRKWAAENDFDVKEPNE